jgi:4-amino-4-deoxy-L-arabinose transferase-like glycosyltransferase
MIARAKAFLATVPRREKVVVASAMALCAAFVLIYMAISPSHVLSGDEPVYDQYGQLFADGKPWQQDQPWGDPHPSAWKAPLYPTWVGLGYTVLGTGEWPGGMAPWERLEIVQALLLAPLTILLIWLLARRLLGPTAAMAAAVLAAVFPLVWEPFGLLFPEALAIPLFLWFLIVVLDREPTIRRSAAAGALLGVLLLLHPTAVVLGGTLAVAWVVAAGWRVGLARAALAAGVAVLVIVPWAVRNAVVFDGAFIPLTIQDAAIYGTFNDDAANDPVRPWSWRIEPASARETLDRMRAEHVDEAEFHSTLRDLGVDYIQAHPFSVFPAMFYNGISRYWDLRPPGQAIDEAKFDGRSTKVRGIGMLMYYPLLILAVVGLWRLRRRREIVLPLLAAVVLVAIVFMIIGATRYRAPFEPVLVILACSLLAPRERLVHGQRSTERESGAEAMEPAAA